jgi:HEAT repeat protein
LIAAVADASLRDCRDLAQEAARRLLAEAVPALEVLCRRSIGYGVQRPARELVAAVEALAAIGGPRAAEAVARIIAEGIAQGPGIAAALNAASRLGSRLPDGMVLDLLRHAEPAVRADAACCARRPQPAIIAALIDLLEDLNPAVASAAACALGRMGCAEARPMLLRLLGQQQSAEVIDAVSGVADDACIVLLGRIARSADPCAADALQALRDMDDDRAAAIVAAIDRGRDRSA